LVAHRDVSFGSPIITPRFSLAVVRRCFPQVFHSVLTAVRSRKQEDIDVTLIIYSMADTFSVIVCADRIATNGDTANKIGTYTGHL